VALISPVGFQSCSSPADVILPLNLGTIKPHGKAIGVGLAHRDTQAPVTMEALLVTTLATSDALAKLLIEKGLITQEELMAKILEERAVYQRMLKPTVQ
jgi:hypothetical protein